MNYKEKVEFARDWYNDPTTTEVEKERLRELFPEVTVSEEERIRKIMLKFFRSVPKNAPFWNESIKMDKQGIIDWLEKIQTDKDMKELLQTEYENGRADQLKDIKSNMWSEEDRQFIDLLISIMNVEHPNGIFSINEEQVQVFNSDVVRVERIIDWLKLLKDRAQAKPEWREEDEDILNTIINHFKVDIECTDEDDIVRWLKSLKPQNRWKPSEEQMKVLSTICITGCIVEPEEGEVISSLYDDLKELKG